MEFLLLCFGCIDVAWMQLFVECLHNKPLLESEWRRNLFSFVMSIVADEVIEMGTETTE